MTNRTEVPVDFDARLVDWLERTAPVAEPDHLLERVLATTATTRRRPAWIGSARPLAWLEPSAERLGRTLLVAATVALLILAFVVALAVGSRPQVPLPLGRPGLLIAGRVGELQLVTPTGAVTARVATGEFAGYGAWSRDGSRLAYATGPLDDPVLVVADGSLRTILTIDVPAGTYLPVTWAPDGRRIAFWVDNTEITQVFVVDVAQGAVPVPITDRELQAQRPSWSPDGDWIAFRGGIELDQQALYVAHPDGNGARRLSSNARAVDVFCGFSWAPDARSLLFSTLYAGAWSVGVDGSDEVSIPDAVTPAFCPTISPDGTRMAVLADTETGKRGWIVDLRRIVGDTGIEYPHALVSGPLWDTFPAVWSPDGRSIAVNGRVLDGGPNPRLIVDADAAEPTRTFHLDGNALFADWQRLAP